MLCGYLKYLVFPTPSHFHVSIMTDKEQYEQLVIARCAWREVLFFYTKHALKMTHEHYTVNHVHALNAFTSVTPQVRPGLSVQRSNRSKLFEKVLMTKGFENWAVVE